jgi:hypothetical protein
LNSVLEINEIKTHNNRRGRPGGGQTMFRASRSLGPAVVSLAEILFSLREIWPFLRIEPFGPYWRGVVAESACAAMGCFRGLSETDD